jgi:hypothetical protein
MNRTPETQLQGLLRRLTQVTSPESDTRRTAVRWFNRLYYDVRKWNESFIGFLRSYPGFSDSPTLAEYRAFIESLGEYRTSLTERYGFAKHDLCSNLKILSARFTRDFSWLHRENEYAFWQIRELIDDSYATEAGIIGIAQSVCEFIWGISSEEQWHVDHHDEVVRQIRQYEDESRQAVNQLQRMADEVGVHLLSVSEYEAALTSEGSRNPDVMVIGEVSMSQDHISVSNVVGPVNIKSKLDRVSQVVSTAPKLDAPSKEEFQRLLQELQHALESVATQKPQDAERVTQAAETVANEVAKDEPSKSFLAITAEGLKEAAKTVASIAPSVLTVAEKIATFVGGLF